jgi:hypothetical protein
LIRQQIAIKRNMAEASADHEAAEELVVQAIKLARVPGQLAEASRLMEAAFCKHPPLRANHEYQLQLWRKGVVM